MAKSTSKIKISKTSYTFGSKPKLKQTAVPKPSKKR
jgi:hypothetical protein